VQSLKRWLYGHNPHEIAVEQFHETQRRRLIQTNMLAIIIAAIACLTELFISSPDEATVHLLIATPFFLGYYMCHVIAVRSENVELLARIWMAVGCVALWADIAISGGITGHAAPMLFLLPIGSALILSVRDIAVVSISNAIAIFGLAAFDIWGPLGPELATSMVVSKAWLLAVNAICISATVVVLVMHTNKVEKALRGSLAKTVHISEHDQLTGLLNRKWINERLAGLQQDVDLGVLCLVDLDGFKQINDVHGHAIGDALLRAVSERLKAISNAGDDVARLGGDEFLILSPGTTKREAESLARRIVDELSAPFQIDDLQLVISGSVGLAAFPGDAQTGEQLMMRADMALYAAKLSGRNQFAVFDAHLEEKQRKRNGILRRLRRAIENGEIYLEYQPQFDLASGVLLGFEALARWTDEEIGVVPPSEFIQIAEEHGLINQLGEHLLRRACREAKYWVNLEAPTSPMRLSVNLSPLQLSQSDMASVVHDILEETGFPGERLELEITERVLIEDPDLAERQLKKLCALGIDIALDDFGTGYSSLSYLQSLSLARLKIDQAFIANMDKPKGEAFIRAIVQLAKALDLKVIAEGVETHTQLEALKAMHCCAGQGYLFSRAVGPAQMLSMALKGHTSIMIDGAPTMSEIAHEA